jgi:hypothetical protein
MFIARGVLITLVAGPVMLGAGAVAAICLLSALLSVPDPLTGSPLDLLVDPTGGASYTQYVVFMLSAGVAGLAFAAMKWAFTGEVD